MIILQELLTSLKAIADEKRLKLLTLLLKQDYCVGALAKELGISKSAVSQHLKVLRKSGLVSGEKRGYWVHYSVQEDKLIKLSEKLKELIPGSNFQSNGCCHYSD
ncbi:metalloregulator ArsR/SmtB family transcription factor [Sporohalobacter salinus]|uniref:metalloregulator ArsR/SmtB family transcription factor n=1 Tax=Sporohalobacter salinus TaxID=1494606 RepID=UPI00195F5E62|nr:DNA-binding transcriptional ArsR family regulator [Sporohalobacter salinus]